MPVSARKSSVQLFAHTLFAITSALKRLNVGDNQLCGHWETPDFSGYKALISAVEKHKLDAVNITEALDVSGQRIGPAGAKKMASFIQGNGALTSLNVSDNNLTDYGDDMSGIKALAAAIPECK